MKTAAVIAEFNPFHKGHEYFIKKVRESSGAGCLIAVMSGDFVQRGAPAAFNKYLRTKAALEGGCDMVLELPVRYSVSSAQYFASGAVSIIDSLGAVDELWFGSECGDARLLMSAADVLYDEPDTFKEYLRESLRQGSTYPYARAKALERFTGTRYGDVLSAPNNILGLEYCIAARRLGSDIRPRTLKRIGPDHASPDAKDGFMSAAAIRELLSAGIDTSSENWLPGYSYDIIKNEKGILCADDFSQILRYKILYESTEDLAGYNCVGPDLAARIKKEENHFSSFTGYASHIKTRNYTYSHICRAFINIILNIRKFEDPVISRPETVRILGASTDNELFGQLKNSSSIVLQSKASLLKGSSAGDDLNAANLYESVRSMKFKTEFVNELSRPFIKI